MVKEKKIKNEGKKEAKAKAAPAQSVIPASDRKARAIIRFVRISPRKIRLVMDAIRKQPAQKAFETLSLIPKKGARLTEKLLTSAVANAKVLGMDEARLYVSNVWADGGPVMKRFLPRSMGRADRLLKRSAHLTLELKEGIKVWRSFPTAQAAHASEETSKPEKKSFLKKKKTAKAGA